MLAIFKTGGKQYSVKAGQVVKVEKLEGKKYKFGAYRSTASGNGKMAKGSEYYYFYRVEPLDDAAPGGNSTGDTSFKPSDLEA